MSEHHHILNHDGSKLHFRGQHDNEKVQFFFRRHWLTLVPTIAKCTTVHLTILSILALSLSVIKQSNVELLWKQGMFIAMVGIFTYYLHRLMIKGLNWYMDIIVVTDQRIVDVIKTSYLYDNAYSIALQQAQEIKVRKEGISQSLFNYGTIMVTTSASNEVFVLENITNPIIIMEKLNQAKYSRILEMESKYRQSNSQWAERRKMKIENLNTSLVI